MPILIKKLRVISSGDKEREILNNVAFVKFERPLLFHGEMDFGEFISVMTECFNDVFTPEVCIDCEIEGNLTPDNRYSSL